MAAAAILTYYFVILDHHALEAMLGPVCPELAHCFETSVLCVHVQFNENKYCDLSCMNAKTQQSDVLQ